ncbi:hypothetical protein K435DRAFT_808254 [Dendrothele bispora CBS 962.96]|uniref:Uncharacterized protein n=1 Tax=Dendrothele bispora (strain CBS 962.96) TaxID=1314807 RepID=A0A4S8L2I4_DENBC|nr:hypothetical protein K435DRAFT_808254 [Dendrothele bispora CBS 962.96]
MFLHAVRSRAHTLIRPTKIIHRLFSGRYTVEVHNNVLFVPAEVATALGWQKDQPYVTRLSLGGVAPEFFAIAQTGTPSELLIRGTIEAFEEKNMKALFSDLKRLDDTTYCGIYLHPLRLHEANGWHKHAEAHTNLTGNECQWTQNMPGALSLTSEIADELNMMFHLNNESNFWWACSAFRKQASKAVTIIAYRIATSNDARSLQQQDVLRRGTLDWPALLPADLHPIWLGSNIGADDS